MAVFVIPNSSLLFTLQSWLAALPSTVTVRLYVNDYTPVASSDLDDFTEPTWDFYTPQDADWGSPTLVGNIAQVQTPLLTFDVTTVTGPGTAYGYFVLNPNNDGILFAERFTTPQVAVNGVPIQLTVTFRHRNT